MHKEKEIEFKSSLSNDEYLILKNKYENSFVNIIEQNNFYFDTFNYFFMKKQTTVRIRQINKEYFLQIKTKTENYKSDEFHKKISFLDFKKMKEGFRFKNKKVTLITSLKTTRHEFNYNNNLVCLDYNQFIDGSYDFELEMETKTKEQGYKDFLNFLDENKLKLKEIRGKRFRAFKAAKLV